MHNDERFNEVFERLNLIEGVLVFMAENFDALNAAVDRAVSLINEAVTILNTPHADNNNQDVIDALTLRLTGAADALAGAEAPAAAPAAAPADTPPSA